MITNQNGNLFPLFDLNSPVNFIRLLVGDLGVPFAGKSPTKEVINLLSLLEPEQVLLPLLWRFRFGQNSISERLPYSDQ